MRKKAAGPRSAPEWFGMAGLAGAAALAVLTSIATWVQWPVPVSVTAGLGLVELNATCRPYELGWLLAAWSGREPIDTGG